MAAVLGPALTVATLAVVVLLAGGRYREARLWVGHTHDVLARTQATLSHVQDAETGQRGFLLTGERAYLAPYDGARAAIPDDLARLTRLTHDNPAQQRRVGALRSFIAAKLAELDTTVRLRERSDALDALSIVRANRGSAYMDSIRATMDTLVATESALLALRERRESASAQLAVIVVVLGSALAVALALMTNRLLVTAAERNARQASELVAANEILQDQAAELEIQAQQLQEQQVELESTNDHLQEQAATLEVQQAELQMQAEEAERARLEAEQANQAKGQFLSTMSHELRTPLNGIAGHTQLIELGIHGPVTDAQRQALARITRAQQHLLS
ncbi:MAG: CHASE3 domain-containing protein, partial [Gemmatirosa sp.]|nr:CHASE3 domain-containing protein [Gemmatirosa sp.]